LAQFVNANKGDANSLIMMGAVMLGGIITGKPLVSQPPPGLAGIIILMLLAACAVMGKTPAAAKAAKDLRNVSRRMVDS
jgi:hypothetical protein